MRLDQNRLRYPAIAKQAIQEQATEARTAQASRLYTAKNAQPVQGC